MPIETWTLGTLRRRVREEFGLQDDSETNRLIDDKINQAVRWLIRSRPTWPWLNKELVLDIPDGTSGVGDFTKGSRNVVVASGSPSPRDIIVVSDASSDGTSGYLVVTASGTTTVLQSQYIGATVSNKTFQIQTGYIELPEDFVRMDTTSDLRDLDSRVLHFKQQHVFDQIRRQNPSLRPLDRLYTIRKDPLGTSKRFFMAVFPYIGTLTTIIGQYYHIPEKLEESDDVPPVPIENRDVLFYAAAWFVGRAKGHEETLALRDQAMDELRIMKQEYELSDDDSANSNPDGVWDLSELRDFDLPGGESDFNPSII